MLVFADAAWEQLLGRTARQLVTSSLEVLKQLEHRLLFLRVSMGFGWYLGDTTPVVNDGDDDEKEEEGILRKGKVLKVFKSRKEGEEKKEEGAEAEAEAKAKGMGKGTKKLGDVKRVEEIDPTSDSVGEVGRLCIWCVKM